MPKIALFIIAMAIYYIVAVVLISKLVMFPLLKAMMLLFFIGIGMVYTRKWRKKWKK